MTTAEKGVGDDRPVSDLERGPVSVRGEGRHTGVDFVSRAASLRQLDPSATVSVPVDELIDVYSKLASQPVIEQAKGIIIGYYRVRPEAAFQVLSRWSQNRDMKLRVLAAALVQAAGGTGLSGLSPEEALERWLQTSQSNSE